MLKWITSIIQPCGSRQIIYLQAMDKAKKVKHQLIAYEFQNINSEKNTSNILTHAQAHTHIYIV